MNDADQPPLTPDEALTATITGAIDHLTDLAVTMAVAIDDDEDEGSDGPGFSLVIGEGIMARLLAAYVRSNEGDEAELDRLLEVNARHIRDLTRFFWGVIRDVEYPHAAPDA